MEKVTARIGDFIKIYKGKKAVLVSDSQEAGYQRFIQIDDLRNNNKLKFTNSKGVSVNPNDIIIAWDGANAGTVGQGLSGIIGSTLAKIEIQKNNIIPQYLGWFLKGKFRYLRDRCTGATIPHISREVLTNILIPLPSTEDQKRIVKILDAADALRQKRKQAITLLDDYLQSTFLQISRRSTQTVKLKCLIKDKKGSARTGPFGSDLKHSEFVDSGIAVIGIDNAVKNKFEWKERRFVTDQKYEKLKRYTLFPRDVIITIMGTVGRSAVIPYNIPLSINTKHLAALTLDESKANPYFISHAIHSDPRIKKQVIGNSRGAIMSGLNLGIIKNLELPELKIEDQNQFEQIYLKVEFLKQKMLTQSQELETQFQALMQKAFKGEL